MRLIPRLLVVILPVFLACAEERPLYPVDDPLTQLLHEPYENREAEELALELSAQLTAPKDLYDRLHHDLTAIRTTWGDSVPIVMHGSFTFRYIPGEVVLFLHDEIDVTEWLARSDDFHRLRLQFKFDSMLVVENRIVLRTHYLLNTTYLLPRIERLPGVCWAQTTPQYGYGYRASMIEDTIDYDFGIPAWCIGWVCLPSRNYYFSSDQSDIRYVGEMVLRQNDTVPDDFKDVLRRRHGTSHNEQPDSIKFRDETPPGRATDVRFLGEQIGGKGMISFTATGDDGNEGAAYSATVCVSVNPNITDVNFNTVGYHYVKVNPGFSGDEHIVSFDKLRMDRPNYYAVRFVDCNQNLSRVSNIAESRNIWLNGWTYFNTDNSPLPSNQVTEMIRDSRDRLWIGTNAGLACLDGSEWQIYNSASSPLPYDHITGLSEAPDGSTWIGTVRGLANFDGVHWKTFTRHNSELPKEEIKTLTVGADGTVWLGYAQYGLIRWDGQSWTVFTTSNSPLTGGTISSLLEDSRGTVWIATNRGVNTFAGDSMSVFEPSASAIGDLNSVVFYEDIMGRLWLSAWNGLASRIEDSEWRVLGYHGARQSLTHFADGEIWAVGGENVWKITPSGNYTFNGTTTGLPSRDPVRIVAANPRILWIGTSDKGLCRWDLEAAELRAPDGTASIKF